MRLLPLTLFAALAAVGAVPASAQEPKKDGDWGRRSKTISFWLLVILIPVAFIQLAGGRGEQPAKITYSQYTTELERDNVAKITIEAVTNVVTVKQISVTAFREQLLLDKIGDRGFSGTREPGEPQHR